MEVCRVCLATRADKNINELRTTKKEGHKSPPEIMQFCLGIQVEEDSKVTNKLCTKCFKKIRGFHKFKAMAIKNDANLRSVTLEVLVKVEPVNEGFQFPMERESGNEDEIFMAYNIKEEFTPLNLESDDEILSTLKCIKSQESTENPDLTELIECKLEDGKNKIGIPKRKQKRKSKKPLSNSNAPPNKVKQTRIKTKSSHKKPGICHVCGKYFKDLSDHSWTHLPEKNKKTLPCKDEDCDKLFSTPNARYRHYQYKHLGKKHHCDICNKDIVGISSHKKLVHERETLPFECVMCKKRYITQSALELHLTIHTKDRPYACEQCGKTYRLLPTLRNHIRSVHLKEKSHKCEVCSKSYFKRYHLQCHLRTHTKEKPYECETCGSKFANGSTLRYHQSTHKDTKDHHCNLCSMSFARASYLRAHMISHTKEKKHACKYCGVSFGRSDHRKRHEFTAHQKYEQNGGKRGGKQVADINDQGYVDSSTGEMANIIIEAESVASR